MDRRGFLIGAAGSVLLGGMAQAQYQPHGRELAARLLAAQAEDGAILLPGAGPERVCDPYSANQAVTGLLLGAPPRSRAAAGAAAKRWIDWLLAHQSRDGALDEQRGLPGALKAAGPSRNRVAAAGSFLSLLLAYLDQTGDDKTILARFDPTRRVAESIVRATQKSGLAYSGPDSRVAYLVDNVEAWRGFDSFEQLCARLRKREEAREYRAQADALLAAVDRWMWQQSEGHYAWAVHAEGRRETGVDRWEPSLKAQLVAIALLPEDERRDGLMARLARRVDLPPPIETPEQLERAVWWGRALLSRHDQEALEHHQVRLSKVAWERFAGIDPALLGHALRVGGGKTTPPPPFVEPE